MDIANARTEFASALRQVCAERGIPVETVLETVKAAILAAYRKDAGLETTEGIEVELDAETGELALFQDGKNVTPPGFGRIASQTAKQVILQRIREAEKSAVITEYRDRIGTIQSGMIQRFDGGNFIVDIGRAEAVLPQSEQVFRERYRQGQRMTFLIKEIHDTERSSTIIVSRKSAELVVELFRREVPEVASGAVEIKAIAREGGFRTKIAVFSKQSGVDPVGSCVGQKGVRVQAVISEIGDERIDVIQFSDDTAKFIAAALAPAKGLIVDLDKETKTASVICPVDQLSLAIGREGQNVRLAVKLTGWNIDIKPPKGSEMPEELVDAAKIGLTQNEEVAEETETETQ